MQKKFGIQNPILGNLLTQVNANQVSAKRVKKFLVNVQDDEIQRRLDKLRRDTTTTNNNNNGDEDNIDFNFNDGNDDDDDDDDDMVLMICRINMATSEGAQYQS